MKRKQLEILLSSLKSIPRPKLRFEEYSLDPVSASTIVYLASSSGDVNGKRVVDLGCGAGILSIGTALMGARQIVGVDVDQDSIRTAVENMKTVGVRVEFLSSTIDSIRGPFDTTIMNPPFGSWRQGLDILFLRKATEISRVVYSMHKASDKSDAFLCNEMNGIGKRITRLGEVKITLMHTYRFHQKSRYRVTANLYRTTD